MLPFAWGYYILDRCSLPRKDWDVYSAPYGTSLKSLRYKTFVMWVAKKNKKGTRCLHLNLF